MQIMIMV